MQEIFFLARHVPFWAVPLLVLGAEFGYMFWLKKKKKAALLCAFIALIGLTSVSVYVWVGGPDKLVKAIKKIHRDNK